MSVPSCCSMHHSLAVLLSEQVAECLLIVGAAFSKSRVSATFHFFLTLYVSSHFRKSLAYGCPPNL